MTPLLWALTRVYTLSNGPLPGLMTVSGLRLRAAGGPKQSTCEADGWQFMPKPCAVTTTSSTVGP